ncbi:hypothetical protein OQA88_2026 [Cercophora sp. LCS_1]
MSIDDFLAWNPAVGPNCAGLNVNTYVCVGITPQALYMVELPSAATNLTPPPMVTWTSTPLGTPDALPFTPTISPTHGPMPTNCVEHYQARANQTCSDLIADFGWGPVAEAQFFAWNPVLANDCEAVLEGHWYCVTTFDEPPELEARTVQPMPLPANTTSKYIVYRFIKEEFIDWNPTVGTNCSNIKANTFYCVAVPSSPTTRTAPFPTTFVPPMSSTPVSSSGPITSAPPSSSSAVSTSSESVATPLPTQPTMVLGYRRFYDVETGDGYWDITNSAGVDLSDFINWNSGAGANCSALWASVYVCVGISGPVATFSGTPPLPVPT